jgi:Ca2+-binding RTX toxin-like protein
MAILSVLAKFVSAPSISAPSVSPTSVLAQPVSFRGDESDNFMRGGSTADRMFGLGGGDTMFGENGNDIMYGGDGNDVVNGGNGMDRLEGDNGNDKLFGNTGYDTLLGGAGDDYLVGGEGNDTLIGGAGADLMHNDHGTDKIDVVDAENVADVIVFMKSNIDFSGTDSVVGFSSGEDKIDLTGFGFTALEFMSGLGPVKFDGDYLRIDGDKNGLVDFVVEFVGVDVLAATDFIF